LTVRKNRSIRPRPWGLPGVENTSLSDVGCKRQRKIAQTLEMYAIGPDLARTYFVHQQQVELFERVRHARQKATVFPSFLRRELAFGTRTTMVGLQQPATEQSFQLLDRKVGGAPASPRIPVQIAEEHFVDRAKKPLDSSPALGLARCRKHKPHLQFGCNLLDVQLRELGKAPSRDVRIFSRCHDWV